jgi:helicase
LAQGVSASDLEQRWNVTGLSGVEERWRDERLWLLAGVAEILDLRCFYFHLREECEADHERVKRVGELLLKIRAQVFELQESLKYCSPLGLVLREIRRVMSPEGPRVGPRSIRRLEEAGINSVDKLLLLTADELVRLGVRRDFAEQISTYVSEADHRLRRL